MKHFSTMPPDATEGERALIRIADALEAEETPDKRDAETLIDAVALIRAMIRDKEPPEARREAFVRKVGMHQATGRPERRLTAGDVLRGDSGPHERALAFWLARANGAGHNEAIRQAVEATNKARSSIKRAIEAHPEARETVLMTFQAMARSHRAEHGEDHAGLLEAIERLGS